MRPLAGPLLALVLAACGQERAQPVRPPLWQIEGPRGERGYLFGTIHALERPVEWRFGRVEAALRGSDRIVVEVANLADPGLARTFAAMSQSRGLPPLSQRLDPALRPRLAEALRAAGARESQFDGVETWAAALALARAGQDADDAANGIDRAVVAAAEGRPVVELEGALAQFAIFDRLPAKEQADFLAAVLGDPAGIEGGDLGGAWAKGDMGSIEAETREGLLADPELREALFTGRNRAWSGRIAAMLAKGEHPFVAVGAAHMAGSEGLPAMLTAQGYKVTRLQ